MDHILTYPEKFSLDRYGNLKELPLFSALLRRVFIGRKQLYKRMARVLSRVLDEIEMGKKDDLSPEMELFCLNLIERIQETKEGEVLQEKFFGWRYRLEKELPFEDAALAYNAFQRAEAWKSGKDSFFWEKELSAEEKSLIAEISRKYGRIFRWVLQSRDREGQFFTWIIRDQLPASVYFEFPFTKDKLIGAKMSGRMGRTDILRLKCDKMGKKRVYLYFEGKEEDILDPKKEIALAEGWRLSLEEIYAIFRDKKFIPGNLECFCTGITNWNPHIMGSWNPKEKKWVVTSLNQPYWWEQIPCFEALTYEQVEERYGLKKGNFAVIARATRELPNLDYENSHAFLEVAVPIDEGGVYRIFPFGKFARKFPKNFFELMQTFSATVPGTVAYPDENVYCTERQHVSFVFDLDREKGFQCMEIIKKEIEKARQGTMGYQIGSENCGKWAQDILDQIVEKEKLPNLYYTSLLQAEPRGVMRSIFSWIRRLPPRFRALALNFIHYPWGSWKGTWIIEKEGAVVFKTIKKSTFWRDTFVHLPAHLHHMQKEEILHNRASLKFQRKQQRNIRMHG